MKKLKVIVFTFLAMVLLSAFGKGLQLIKLGVDWDGDSKQNDFVTINKKQLKVLKSGTESQYFDLSFYKDQKKLQNFSVKIDGFEPESEWTVESPFQIDSLHQKKSFVLLQNGYPACGYFQTYFLFVKNSNNKMQLLDQGETYFDAPYGNYQIYKPINEKSFARISLGIGEADQLPIDGEEMAKVSKSDSVVFYQEKDQWFMKKITPKDKVYWSKEMKYDDANNTKF